MRRILQPEDGTLMSTPGHAGRRALTLNHDHYNYGAPRPQSGGGYHPPLAGINTPSRYRHGWLLRLTLACTPESDEREIARKLWAQGL
jgi:hypothetical protein